MWYISDTHSGIHYGRFKTKTDLGPQTYFSATTFLKAIPRSSYCDVTKK